MSRAAPASTTGASGGVLRAFFAVAILVAAVSSSLAENAGAEAGATACRTPSGQSGQCVSLQRCEPLARLSRTGYVSSPADKKLLRDSSCGADLYQAEKVCCPETGADRTAAAADDKDKSEEGDNVSERRLPTFHRRPPGLTREPTFGSGRQSLFDSPFGSIGDPFSSSFPTRRPSTNPFGSNPFSAFNGNSPFGGNTFGNSPFGSNSPFGGNTFGNSPLVGGNSPFGSNGFGSDEYTTRRPASNVYTTRRPASNVYTTRRPAQSPQASGDYTTRRPSGADRTTRRPTSSSRPQGGSGLINPQQCGEFNIDDRIVGGNSTVVKELPWMVRLGYGSGRSVQYRCGGSLINNRYVLTAAHCVDGGDNPTQVRLGEHDEESSVDCSTIDTVEVCAPPVVDVAVEEVIAHPQYSGDSDSPNYLKNDIALLRLRRTVQFTDAVKPICLPTGQRSLENLEGKKARVAGWGKDKNGRGTPGTRYLMKANVPLMTYSECARVYRERGISLEEKSQLCAGGRRGVDSCQGDSGGPLFRPAELDGRAQPRQFQVGVVSFGLQNCGVEGVPGVYTKVQNYMPWITSNMRP